MGGISALWPWWALALRSTSLTRRAVLPCTTLPPPKPSAGGETCPECSACSKTSLQSHIALIGAFLRFRVDRHFSGNHQNNEDEAKESYLWVLICLSWPHLIEVLDQERRRSSSLLSSLPTSCLEHLLDNGADPSMVNSKGYSAVHYAAYHGNKQNLELVSRSCADESAAHQWSHIWACLFCGLAEWNASSSHWVMFGYDDLIGLFVQIVF